jgi:MFS family permease
MSRCSPPAVLTVLVATGLVHVWHILCLSFISGFAQAFGGPAYQALIPTLVDKEDMPNAIALNSIQFNVAVMVGPALAGQALAKVGEKWCFGLNALSFLAPIISLSMITARFLPGKTRGVDVHEPEAGHPVRPQAEFHGSLDRAGFLHDRARHAHAHLHSRLRERHFPSRSGNLRQSAGAHGPGFDLRLADNRQRRQLQEERAGGSRCALICLGAGISGFALSKSVPLSGVILVLVGASMMAVFATVNSLVQLITTNEMRGRVMSVYNVAFRGGMPMGNLLSGWLVPIFTAPVVLGVNGFLLILVALYFLLLQRRLAAISRPRVIRHLIQHRE